MSKISIHALREEGDGKCIGEKCMAYEFLSTPSARRATYKIKLKEYREVNFYPRPPRGGRPLTQRLGELASQFLSTPSARRATRGEETLRSERQISIHALREEGDRS